MGKKKKKAKKAEQQPKKPDPLLLKLLPDLLRLLVAAVEIILRMISKDK